MRNDCLAEQKESAQPGNDNHCHYEEHSEAIVNRYDCRWQSFNRLRDVAISRDAVTMRKQFDESVF